MSTFWLFMMLAWLFDTSVGRLILFILVLWYLDNRYVGLMASLWAPIARAQRISSLRSSVELNPSDVGSMVELGEHYLRSGKSGHAVQYLERAMSRGEDSARAQYLLGAAYVRSGRHSEGRKLLDEALAKAPHVGYGEPHLYLLEEALATHGAQAPRVDQLVGALDRFEGVEVLTRAGRICKAAGRRDLAGRLFAEAVRNYGYIPKRMRRRERRWAFRARLGLWQAPVKQV